MIEISSLESHHTKVEQLLDQFVQGACHILSTNLISIVLYGSYAEDKLRSTSDVNLILVLKAFELDQINGIRELFCVAHAAIFLNVMFLLETEIDIASEAFAVKFTDILSRHKILYGEDPFKKIKISKTATLQRLKQVLINLTLRLREKYVLMSQYEEQLTYLIADVTGPIRATAVSLLAMEGKTASSPKDALEIITKNIPGRDWSTILTNMSTAREKQQLKHGVAETTIIALIELTQKLYQLAISKA